MRRENSVRGIRTVHIKVTVLKATITLVEHIERLRLVLLQGDNRFIEHSFGFFWRAVLGHGIRLRFLGLERLKDSSIGRVLFGLKVSAGRRQTAPSPARRRVLPACRWCLWWSSPQVPTSNSSSRSNAALVLYRL